MAFTGTGHRLDDGDLLMLEDPPAPALTPFHSIPSLKDLCLVTLDRYIDLLEDIGTTPYYLIEGILRKCSGKVDGLSGHARNDFETFRERSPQYDQSGEWRQKYHVMKQEVEDRFERRRAQLRQSYSQHDKFRQDRRVILDPNLRLPKKAIRAPGSSSSWSSAPPKKKTLFEKARLEARKISQMYNSNPYPPPRSRITSSSSSSCGVKPSHTRVVAGPAALAQLPMPSLQPVRPAAPVTQTKRYSYKTRPVVYTSLVKPGSSHHVEESTSPSQRKTPVVHNLITPSAPVAIADFFKEINPAHSHHATSSSHYGQSDVGSRSPSSPLQPSSKTIQMLRDNAASGARHDRSAPGNGSRKQPSSGALMESVKADGDFSWLEDDDDDDGEASHKRIKISDYPRKKDAAKTPVSLEEAGRQFFNRLIGK
ncbi:hypothetical protein BGZ98_000623 [Dissophora globulifera]|nr:hypothetical protein BGZ98_000623 [Dissophora globulifera]